MIKTYPIIQDFHTQNDCYKAARIRAKTHVIVHSTAVKGPAYDPRFAQWNRPNFKKCAHAFVDWNGIYQNLPWNYQGWLNGVTAGNDSSVAFEICEPLEKNDTPETAADLYGKTLYLCYVLCKEFNIPPARVVCHAEAYKLGLANNHGDVLHWWGKKGTAWEPYTMTRLRNDLAEALGVARNFPYEALVATLSSPLNIWSDTSKSRSIAQVQKGGTLTVTGDADAANWFAVSKDSVSGYADGQYLQKIESAPSDEPEDEVPVRTSEDMTEDMTGDEDAAQVPASELRRLLELVEALETQVVGRLAEIGQVLHKLLGE